MPPSDLKARCRRGSNRTTFIGCCAIEIPLPFVHVDCFEWSSNDMRLVPTMIMPSRDDWASSSRCSVGGSLVVRNPTVTVHLQALFE